MSHKVTILAEVGSTHDGSLGNALRMVEVWAELGADAIKFQCHHGQEVDENAPRPPWFKDESRAEYFKRTGFSPEQWATLRRACWYNGVQFVPSVFCPAAVDMLQSGANPDAWKVPSGQLTNRILLKKLELTGSRVFFSTGMTRDTECPCAPMGSDWVWMHCTSEYPLNPEHALWEDMLDLSESHECPWGLSDHSMGQALSLSAVSFGACAIERHVTFSRHAYGSDARHSLEPNEFAQLVREIRWLERAMASTVTRDELMATPEMQEMRKVFVR